MNSAKKFLLLINSIIQSFTHQINHRDIKDGHKWTQKFKNCVKKNRWHDDQESRKAYKYFNQVMVKRIIAIGYINQTGNRSIQFTGATLSISRIRVDWRRFAMRADKAHLFERNSQYPAKNNIDEKGKPDIFYRAKKSKSNSNIPPICGLLMRVHMFMAISIAKG